MSNKAWKFIEQAKSIKTSPKIQIVSCCDVFAPSTTMMKTFNFAFRSPLHAAIPSAFLAASDLIESHVTRCSDVCSLLARPSLLDSAFRLLSFISILISSLLVAAASLFLSIDASCPTGRGKLSKAFSATTETDWNVRKEIPSQL